MAGALRRSKGTGAWPYRQRCCPPRSRYAEGLTPGLLGLGVRTRRTILRIVAAHDEQVKAWEPLALDGRVVI